MKISNKIYYHYMKSFQGFLKDFKLNEGLKGEFTVDDLVEVHGHQSSIKFHGETGTIIHLGTNNALVRFDTRFNDNLHSGDGRDPSSCSYYIKYELLTLVNKDPDIRRIRFSFELKEVLDTIKDDVYAKLLIALIRGVNKSILVADPVDFLNFETDGTISCLKSRYFEEAKGKEWESPRRTKVRANRILRDIYNPEYLASNLKETDVNAFVTKWAAITAPPKMEEFRGDDVMRAYNYKHELTKKFGASCANFHQKELNGGYSDPTVGEFDIYTKNPDNCGVVVVWDKGEIVARRSFQQGPNLVDSGHFKKGEMATVWGNYYGVGGSGSKYDRAITEYLKKKYNAIDMYDNSASSFIIKLKHTRFRRYCPFDSMQVCFEENLLANQRIPAEYRNLRWHDTYHARCPEELLGKE